MGPRFSWYALAPIVLVAPASAHATTYLTVAQAQRQMFPAASGFVDRSVDFTSAQRKEIARTSGTSAPRRQRLYEARGGGGRMGWLIIDQVLGKHEMITYALALAPDGAVRSVEILDYRETYGGEIRGAAWRRQFAGKRAGQSLKLGKDIQNISGATLSSSHVTDGIRRLLVTYQLLLAGG
ncbi:MAG: FMN-binding protein [Sphingomicrobium sp.]